MDEATVAINKCAQIFLDEVKLSKALEESYVDYKSEIQTYVTNLGADWDSSDYYGAGQSLADLMILAVGPM